MSQEPQALTWFLPEPVTITNRTLDRINIEIYNFDDTLAPEGKTVVKVMLSADYGYWKGLLDDDQAKYDHEKQRIAAEVLKLLEQRFPGISAQVEMTDVATPITTERFTGNWRGLQAWSVPGEPLAMLKGLTRTLPGLSSMYMVGQWAEATIGLPTAAISGRRAIRNICRLDRKRFRATVDEV
jgi:phytoene dehydrogenase-like protein